MRKVTCKVCGCYVFLPDNVDIQEVENAGFIFWGIEDNDTFLVSCLGCGPNANRKEDSKPKKGYRIKDKRRIKRIDMKPIDTKPKILYREI